MITVLVLSLLVTSVLPFDFNPYAPARVTILPVNTRAVISERLVLTRGGGQLAVCDLAVGVLGQDIDWSRVSCVLTMASTGSSSVSSIADWSAPLTHSWAFYYKIGNNTHTVLTYHMLLQERRSMTSQPDLSSHQRPMKSLTCCCVLTMPVSSVHPPAPAWHLGHGQGLHQEHSQHQFVIVDHHLAQLQTMYLFLPFLTTLQ